jgi:hypothetical protein
MFFNCSSAIFSAFCSLVRLSSIAGAVWAGAAFSGAAAASGASNFFLSRAALIFFYYF